MPEVSNPSLIVNPEPEAAGAGERVSLAQIFGGPEQPNPPLEPELENPTLEPEGVEPKLVNPPTEPEGVEHEAISAGWTLTATGTCVGDRLVRYGLV